LKYLCISRIVCNFFYLQWVNLIGPSQKKLKLWRLPKIEDSMKRCSYPPLAHLYGWEGEDFGQKHMGLMWGGIGNTIGEHIGNLGNTLGTWWEPEENMLDTLGVQLYNLGRKLHLNIDCIDLIYIYAWDLFMQITCTFLRWIGSILEA
jgi:hypothetical protein